MLLQALSPTWPRVPECMLVPTPGYSGKGPKMLVSLFLFNRPAREKLLSTPGA